jgi:hypothetical protein
VRTPGSTVVEGKLHRIRQGREKRFAAAPTLVALRRPARLAVTLAFAHQVRRAIARGEMKDQAEAARRYGLTRTRLTQVLDLTHLAPDLQEEILFLEAVDGHQPLGDRALRPVLRHQLWADQREIYRRLHLRSRNSKGRLFPGPPPTGLGPS